MGSFRSYKSRLVLWASLVLGLIVAVITSSEYLPTTLSLVSRSIIPQLSSQLWTSKTIDTLNTFTIAPHVHPSRNEHLELGELRDLVAQTKGYYTRDYNLDRVGWNNVRIIIEAALSNAKLLNRTLVIPSFMYARSCEYDISVCATFAAELDIADLEVFTSESRKIWQIPINAMLNITQLRRFHPVILVSDYLRLHGLPLDLEQRVGNWDTVYHQKVNIFAADTENAPSLFVIKNSWYEPEGTVRVDSLTTEMKARGDWNKRPSNIIDGPGGLWGTVPSSQISELLDSVLPEGVLTLTWDQACYIAREMASAFGGWEALGITGMESSTQDTMPSDDKLETMFVSNGWEVLHTYHGAEGMEHSKQIVEPIRAVAPRKALRGFKDDFGDVTADVIYLVGDIHGFRKPGFLLFSTPENRDDFSQLVFHHFRAVDKVFDLAARLDHSMRILNGGRPFVAAHMRRADFIKHGWVAEKTIEGHFQRIMEHLATGNEILHSPMDSATSNSPLMRLPLGGDKIYIATDEMDQGNLTYLSSQGALLIRDLITTHDRREFGWTLLFTDVLGLVEQALLARAAFFYGDAISTFSGGVANMRAAQGYDRRLTVLQHFE